MTPKITFDVPQSDPHPWQWTESNSPALGTVHTASTVAASGIVWHATIHRIADGWAYSLDEGAVQNGVLSLTEQIVESVEPFASPDEAKDHLAQWSNYLIAEYVAAEITLDDEVNDVITLRPPPVPRLSPSPIPQASDLTDPAKWHVLSPTCILRFSKSFPPTLRLLVTESPTEVEFTHRYRWQWTIDLEIGVDATALTPIASGFARTAYAARQLALAAAAAYHVTPDALPR